MAAFDSAPLRAYLLGLQQRIVGAFEAEDGKPFVTDAGNTIIDISVGAIPEPDRLGNLLSVTPGVVDHGLFIGICGIILMASDDGVKTFRKA